MNEINIPFPTIALSRKQLFPVPDSLDGFFILETVSGGRGINMDGFAAGLIQDGQLVASHALFNLPLIWVI